MWQDNGFMRNFADLGNRGNDTHHAVLLSEPLTRFFFSSLAIKISEIVQEPTKVHVMFNANR